MEFSGGLGRGGTPTFGLSPVFRGRCLPSAAFFRRRDRVCLSDFSGRAEFSKKRSGPSEYDDDEGRRRGRNGDKNHHRRPIHPSIYKLPSFRLKSKEDESTLLYSRSPSAPFYGSLSSCVVEERRSPPSLHYFKPSLVASPRGKGASSAAPGGLWGRYG